MLSYTYIQHPNSHSHVTFIHGAGGSSAIWYKQIRAFKKSHNVLLIDLRGHGKSKSKEKRRAKDYNFISIGNEVIEVMDHLKIKSSHFVGISLGTIIIRELAMRFPERFDSLIMGGAVMHLNFRGQFLMRLGATLKSLLPYLILYRFFAFIIMPKKKHRESRNLFIREAKKLYQKEFKRWFLLIAEVNPLLSIFKNNDLGIPTLYVMGSEDYMFLPSIKKLAAKHRSAQLHIIEACGHVVNVEKASVFNELVLNYIKLKPQFAKA